MSLDKYKQGILKTGFVLENSITESLRNRDWTVISNKYYEDDFEEKVREIDLLAYKVGRVQDFDVYTCLIISCKKNQSNHWALLCRDINFKDPNSDWWPLHSWSNKKSIGFQLSLPNQARRYYLDMAKLGVKDALADPKVDVFAFQEMNSDSGVPKNDTAIYDSVISLIKAQAYEIGSLPQRKKAPCIYQFNLISVIDSKIIRLAFANREITPAEISSEHYVSRYILKKKQSFSRIRFMVASVFEDSLKDYDQLHKANKKWFDKLCNDFFNGVEKDIKRLRVYLDEFREEIRWSLHFRAYKLTKKEVDTKDVSLWWNTKKEQLVIDLTVEQDILDALNADPETNEFVAAVLKKIYRYDGLFYFDNDIPF
jgi:hypothetical protein